MLHASPAGVLEPFVCHFSNASDLVREHGKGARQQLFLYDMATVCSQILGPNQSESHC